MKGIISSILPYVAVLFICACTGPAATNSSDSFVVEGDVQRIGNEPFSRMVLKSDDLNSYVLVFAEGTEPSDLGRYRVIGRLHAADWNGKRRAHIAVASIDVIE